MGEYYDLADIAEEFSQALRDIVVAIMVEKKALVDNLDEILALPGVDGVRIFVLGPPEDERMLMRARPSSRPGQVYRDEGHALALDDALSAAFLAAAGEFDSDDWRRAEAAKPFAGNFRLARNVVEANPERYAFFHQHYGFDAEDPDHWRRIGTDWQASAESLALKLDSATNNTSLVLAIELESSGRVLLFAADAQVGNWESWHDHTWTAAEGLGRDERVTAEDLLRRTVLYKVGHHGSHNATLREKGLEMMSSPELSAMIPVDSKWAYGRRPHPWKMPFDPLYEDLLRRTGSRILRSDVGLVKPERAMSAWDDFAARVDAKDLYLELEISDT